MIEPRTKRRRILRVFLALVFLVGLLIVIKSGSEPTYEGKRLGQYLDEMAHDSPFGAPEAKKVEAVYQMGPRAIPYLRTALRVNESWSLKALAALHRWLPQRLAKKLPDPPSARYLTGLGNAAAECLATFGPAARPAMPDLLDTLSSGSVLGWAKYAIEQIGPQPEDLPDLLPLVASTNLHAKVSAIELLGTIGVAEPEVITALVKVVTNTQLHPNVRWIAMNSLGEFGSNAVPAIPFLTGTLQDSDPEVRAAAALSLLRIQGSNNAAMTLLVKEAKDESETPLSRPRLGFPGQFSPHEWQLLVIALGAKNLGNPAQPLVPALREIRGETNVALRLATAQALWAICQETNEVESIAQAGLVYFDPYRQADAAELLANVCIARQRLAPELNAMLSHTNPAVQFQAARALWKISGRTDDTIPIFAACLHDHTTYYHSKETRRLAAEILGEMGSKASAAVPALQSALFDIHESVRCAATNALRRIEETSASKK